MRDDKILTPMQVDCFRRIGRNKDCAHVAWVEMDALCYSHEELRAEVERLQRIVGSLPAEMREAIGGDDG